PPLFPFLHGHLGCGRAWLLKGNESAAPFDCYAELVLLSLSLLSLALCFFSAFPVSLFLSPPAVLFRLSLSLSLTLSLSPASLSRSLFFHISLSLSPFPPPLFSFSPLSLSLSFTPSLSLSISLS